MGCPLAAHEPEGRMSPKRANPEYLFAEAFSRSEAVGPPVRSTGVQQERKRDGRSSRTASLPAMDLDTPAHAAISFCRLRWLLERRGRPPVSVQRS